MVFNLSDYNTIGNTFIAELRDKTIQNDAMRFRRNLERVGELLGYEISKTLDYHKVEVETPMGIAEMSLPKDKVVLATILRAGLPLHQGLLNYFDHAGNAFASAYRRHHKNGSFDIKMGYITCPDLNDTVLILADPMLATGASMDVVLKALMEYGTPKEVHIVTAISSVDGLNTIKRLYPDARIWLGALDEELTAKSYIVPGLGDAGDLSYGAKLQE